MSSARRSLLLMVPAAALALCTALFFRFHPTYVAVGPDLVENGCFDVPDRPDSAQPFAGWSGWSPTVTWGPSFGFAGSGGVRLTATPKTGRLFRRDLGDPSTYEYLQVTGRLKTEGLVDQDGNDEQTRVLLFFKDGAGRPHWDHPHEIRVVEGTRDWTFFKRAIVVPEWAASAHVCVQQLAVAGTAWVDEISVRSAAVRRSFLVWRLLFLLGWLATGIWYVVRLRLFRRRYGVCVAVLSGIILVGALCPSVMVNSAVRTAARQALCVRSQPRKPREIGARPATHVGNRDAAHSMPPAPDPKAEREQRLSADLKTGAHSVLFALLACFSLLSFATATAGDGTRTGEEPSGTRFSGSRFFWVVAGLILFSACTEILQLTTLTRQLRAFDFAFNLLGLALGLLFWSLWLIVRGRHR